MVFQFITENGEEKNIGKPREEKPVRAALRGTAEGALSSYGNLLSLIPGYQPGELTPGQKARTQLEYQASERDLPGLLTSEDLVADTLQFPTSEQVNEFLTKLGLPKEEVSESEQGLGRFGRLFGSLGSFGLSPLRALSAAFTGAGAAELGKKAGIGEKGQNILELLGSLRFNTPAAQQTGRIRQPRINERELPPSQAGFISPERATQQLNRINTEAADIASKIGSTSKPFQQISAAIERGEPIAKRFNQVFTGLEEVAHQFNPPINTAPLNDFLKREGAKYANTGAPTELGKFITEQIQGWQHSGKDNLYNGFRRYRLNNEKIREILDATPPGQKLSDLQRNQMGFLTRMNDALEKSFQTSLSGNLPSLPGQTGNQANLWLKTFQDSNSAYSQYLKTRQARSILDPILQENVTDKKITSFLQNPKSWDDLDRLWGKTESSHLKILLQDMLKARNAIQNIPKKEVGSEVFKHALLSAIPGLGKITSLLSIPKVWNWARGRYHSGPNFQRDFHKLTKALVDQNPEAIASAAANFEKPEKKEEGKKSFFVQD